MALPAPHANVHNLKLVRIIKVGEPANADNPECYGSRTRRFVWVGLEGVSEMIPCSGDCELNSLYVLSIKEFADDFLYYC